MKKRQRTMVVGIIIVILMSMLSAVSFAYEDSDKKGSTKSKKRGHKFTIMLKPQGDAPKGAEGTAKFTFVNPKNKMQKTTVKVTVNKLKTKPGKVYRVWLRDKRKEAPYTNVIATFQTNKRGFKKKSVTTYLPAVSHIDEILITHESRRDIDLRLDRSQIVMRGKLD